jgi:hypothetical protein
MRFKKGDCMTVQPPAARYTIERTGMSLVLTVPSRKNWIQIIFVGIWSMVWLLVTLGVFGGILFRLLGSVVTQAPAGITLALLGPGLFFLVWSALWLFGGLFAIYNLLWQLVGREIIEFNPEAISVMRKTFILEPPKMYDGVHVKELRVSLYAPQMSWWYGANRSFWSRNYGTLAFDYGAKTVRFGDMEEAEAKMALAEILRDYPDFGKNTG